MFKSFFALLFPFADFIYILQLEEYSSARYLHWVQRFFWRRHIQRRQHIKWTPRALLILVLAVGTSVLLVGIVGFFAPWPVTLIVGILNMVWVPYFVLIAHWMTGLIVAVEHRRTLARAATLISSRPHLSTIVIAGSYGKTTTKNMIYEMLRFERKVQMIEGNINTPIGIAEWVIAKLAKDTQILLLEMDTYGIGEISRSCQVVSPDVALITNIGDQHLERFTGRAELAQALAEVFTHASQRATLIAPKDVWEHLPLETNDTHEDQTRIVAELKPVTLYGHTALDLTHLHIAQLHAVRLALEVAHIYKLSERFVEDIVAHPPIVERRKVKTVLYGYECLDDSYNISLTTVQESLKLAREMADAAHKKLLVVTAGIPELGVEQRDGNHLLGEYLDIADHIYVLRSILAKQVTDGIKNRSKYTLTRDLHTFVASAHAHHSPGQYVLLVLPELTDLYY